MALDYKEIIIKLKEAEPDITSVAIIEKEDDLVYSTEDWDLSAEVSNLVSVWKYNVKRRIRKHQFIIILEKKYSILQCTPERIVATSYSGEKNIVGAKDDERKIISLVNKDGDMKTAYAETARVLNQMSNKEPYMSSDSKLGHLGFSSWYTQQIAKDGSPTSSKREVIMSLIDFFKKGSKLEKPDELDLQRREAEKKQRMYELEKVLYALEITKADKLVNMIIKAEFTTDYIYDDFYLLRVKHKIIDLLKQEFQTDYLDLKITKNL